MDAPQWSSLAAARSAVPDPRKARSRRHAWPLVLPRSGAALVSGQRRVRAAGQGVEAHAEELRAALRPPGGRLPRTATLRRARRAVDPEALERGPAACEAGRPPAATPARGPVGQALDGQAVRGATRHGAAVHLVSLVRHADARVLGQVRVAATSNERTAAPRLLAGPGAPWAVAGTVTTMDAQLARRAIAAQIRAQRGHDLLVVKANQPELYAAIAARFTLPPPPLAANRAAAYTTVDKGHGRLETRTLERSASRNGHLDRPGVGQVRRSTCRAVTLTTGVVSEEVTSGVTSLTLRDAAARAVEARWRGPWAIEHRVHDVRDVTMGEAAGQQRVGHAPQALAALRNGLLNALRRRVARQTRNPRTR
ncbi:MAG TPA: ISAs1 family transposase [Thermomicrobiales bacterium]|nr:ISAs1 family transposase [Thermomicrobiales bacterium]